ncbi:unnamed protein product [Sphagnum balticum]
MAQLSGAAPMGEVSSWLDLLTDLLDGSDSSRFRLWQKDLKYTPPHGYGDNSVATHGSLIADAYRVYTHSVVAYTTMACRLEGLDSERAAHLLAALKEPVGKLVQVGPRRHPTASTATGQIAKNGNSGSSGYSSSSSLGNLQVDQHNDVQSLKAMFPDCGELFLTACLRAFDGDLTPRCRRTADRQFAASAGASGPQCDPRVGRQGRQRE